MDNRFFWVMTIMLLILMGWSYFFQPRQEASKAPAAAAAPAAATATTALAAGGEEAVVPTRDDITVATPLYVAVFSERGGRLKSFKLTGYNKRKLDPGLDDELMDLITVPQRDDWPMRLSFAADGAPKLENAPFIADSQSLTLAPGETGRLNLTYVSPDGLKVRRVLTFSADTFLTTQKVILENHGERVYQGVLTMRLNSAPFAAKAGRYDEAAAYVDNKLLVESPQDAPKAVAGFKPGARVDWIGYMDQYFLTALVMPDRSENPEAATPALAAFLQDHGGVAVGASRALNLPPGTMSTIDFDYYYGPKNSHDLARAGHNLAKSIDLGWFSFLAAPLAALLRWIYSYCGNYGLAIIIVTFLIKMALWPLVIKSYRSMKEMQTLQPKVAKIRERYGDDKEAMNREIMQLYRTFKINPLGGCLPMLLQIPFFIAFYRVLDSLLELRGAPFIFWIKDLAAPDRLFSFNFAIPFFEPPTGIPVLTLLMGASMVLQQKMTPNTMGDPMQAKIMMMMPVMFTVILINMPAGLVLYWLVNNILSIAQQRISNRAPKAAAR
ncbi:MAG: membrane protein insertase YidC [Candidatus Adiutrix sp.]|jgi:YidC/Oxa1 family membrane protein insertase|nr:membrane protein insertase YidC [Candidatus Adiutrix sp.]